MMEICFQNVQNIRKNVYNVIISPIYHKWHQIRRHTDAFGNIHLGMQ